MTSGIVCAAGVPHVPVFPAMAAGGDDDVRLRYQAVRDEIAQADPTLLVMVANDHLNTFFLDRMPTFAIGLGERLRGPVDDVPGIPAAPIATDPEAAGLLARELVAGGYDLALCAETDADHSVVVPLHFLNPTAVPAVVIYVNGYVTPLPSARRCYDLGRALASAVAALPDERRVAVVASGSFSQEVGGPRVDPGLTWSVPRPDWAAQVAEYLAADRAEAIIDAATPELLADAGSVAGELLSWVTMVGAAGGLRPRVDYRTGQAFAFASWERG